jgi:MFS family permease
MVVAWVMSLFAQTAASTILNAFSAELFPTSHRSTAESAIAVAGTLGGSAGLLMESMIYSRVGNHWRTVSFLMLASVVAAIVMVIFVPETASAELDEISPERSLIWRRNRRRAAAQKKSA